MSQSGDGVDAVKVAAQEVGVIPSVFPEAPSTPSPQVDHPPSMMQHQAMIRVQVMKMKVRCRKQGEEEKKR